VLKVFSDILLGIDAGDLSALVLLDSLRHGRPPHSSAAPGALLWHNWFGTSMAPVLSGWPSPIRPNWFVNFVSSADSVWRTTGVIFGPILFFLYADDTQVCGLCRPFATLELQNIISTCIDDVASWMRSNRLQLNTAMTEVLWSTSSRRLHLLPVSPIRVGTDQIMPVSVVRNLGIYMDADVSMRSLVSKTVAACFAIMRQLRSIRRSVPRSVLQSLVSSLVLQRLDYGNATLADAVDVEFCCSACVFRIEM